MSIRRHPLRLLTVAAVVAGLSLTTAVPASADYFRWGMPSTKFGVALGGSIEAYQVPYFDTARTRWNDTGVSNIARDAKGDNWMETSSRRESWFGQYNYFGGYFRIRINERTIHAENKKGALRDKRYNNTIAHELGHALKLADNPKTSEPSIMKYGSISKVLTSPSKYDISEVRKYY